MTCVRVGHAARLRYLATGRQAMGQGDEHIRRYAELLKAREVSQQDASKPKAGPQGGRPTGIPRQIAEETG